jgi:hypothetical protein
MSTFDSTKTQLATLLNDVVEYPYGAGRRAAAGA